MVISITAGGAIVRNNTINASATAGIDVTNNSTNHVITFNSISGNGTGISYRSGVAGGKAENNTISGNTYGVVYSTAGGDLGGGSASSAGGNVISCNTNADLYNAIATAISAANNKWDHVPPTMSTSSQTGGVDVYSPSGLSFVTTTGSSLASTICP